jgi:hypothetical protein
VNIKISQEQGYTILKVTGIYDSLTALEICEAVIRLLNDNVIKILIDTTGITGYVPSRSNNRIELDCFPYEIRNGSTKVLLLESSIQIGSNYFRETDYNRNGIPIMITVNRNEGMKWLL